MSSALGPRRAVVIEDDPDIRGLLVHVLKGKGFKVSEAATGEEGIGLVRGMVPELVTLDLNLPDGGGLDVCRILR
ncbi:response regulator, partial [Arthrobacter sp. M4]|uniref:response regulator n=1 Tax=Arthrobacter sp. M4 TaxID=218160 RepID=UPI001CDC7028